MSETTEAKEENCFPWKRWMVLAQNGSTAAVLVLCQNMEPIVADFCRNRTFLKLFAADETRSIASLAALEFMMEFQGQTPDREIPYLLRRVIRCRLYDEARRLQVRRRYEMPETECLPSDDGDADGCISFQPAAPEDETPEMQLLLADHKRRLQEILKTLNPKEQELVRALYGENKTSAEIAKEWGCSSRYVRMLRQNVLAKLKKLLRGTE